MSIEKILNNEYWTEKLLGEEFYYIASNEENSALIKKLFLKLDYKPKFTSKVLTYGILATLELNKNNNFNIISQFMEKNKINLDSDILTNALTHPLENNEEESFSSISKFMIEKHVSPDRLRLLSSILDSIESDKSISSILNFWQETDVDMTNDLNYFQIIYNCASVHQRNDIISELNDKFNIEKLSLTEDMGEDITFAQGAHSSWGSLKEDGSLEWEGAMGGELDKETNRRLFYQFNPFLFHLKVDYFNANTLDSFFKDDIKINPSLVQHAIVRSIAIGNSESIKYLFSQPQCAEIIKNSPNIKAFIHSDIDWSDNKIEARLELKTLETNNDFILKNKLKL